MTKIKRVSITLPEQILSDLDAYVELQKAVKTNVSRSSIISDVLNRNIPKIPS